MKSILGFFAERHNLAYILTIMIVMLGISTLLSIRRSIWPSGDLGIMVIVTQYPGASPEDVELNVTNKIERELKSVVGIAGITSVSMENVSIIEVEIDIDAPDQDQIKADVREAVGRTADLPPEVTQSPLITEQNTSEMDVIEVGLVGDLPYRGIREQARLLEKKLRNVAGVARLERFGYRAREVEVAVSLEAVSEYQIPLQQIITAITSRNIRATTGSFESYATEKDLVTLAQFRDPMEVGDVIVRSTFDGPAIRVRDLAIVRDDFEEERILSRMNGEPAITFLVFSSEGADVIRTCDAIKELISAERENLPEGLELQYVNDESRYVRDGFNVVLVNGLIGLILVLILLPVFLDFRTAFWVAMGIPVALLGTIFLLPLFGAQLDTIGLTGMILVIGIIVDDAIIIAENITRRREQGDQPLEAVVEGTREVYLPVVTTVLTTFIVFAPTFFMPGVFGSMVIPVPLAISLALFISLVEATVALPAHLLPGIKRRSTERSRHDWFGALRERYRLVMQRLLRFRHVFVLLFCLVLAGALWYAINSMQMILFPTSTSEHVFIGNELPAGTPLQVTSEKMAIIEDLVAALPEEELASFTTRIGYDPFLGAESENCGSISMNLTHYTKRSRTTDEIVAALHRETDSLEGQGVITYEIVGNNPPVGKPISLRIAGSDDTLRKRLTDSVVVCLQSTPGVYNVTRDDRQGRDHVEIRLDYDQLSRLGLTVADVAQNARIAFDGEIVTGVRYGDEDVNFRVIVEASASREPIDLEQLLIPNREGRLIPLAEVAQLEAGPGPSDMRHYNGERSITVEADVDRELITPLEVTDALLSRFNLSRDWPGMQIVKSGEVFATEESMAGLMRSFAIAIIGVYFLLVLLFNSPIQPFLVMLAIPFGLIGVILAFALHGEPISFMAMMGIIGLCGVVVNDALVLVSRINDLRNRSDGEVTVGLIAEATADRLRAVVLTTLTTVVALLPLAYGLGGTSAFMAPIALALGWGLIFATPVTLVLVPCFYLVGRDICRLFKIDKSQVSTFQ